MGGGEGGELTHLFSSGSNYLSRPHLFCTGSSVPDRWLPWQTQSGRRRKSPDSGARQAYVETLPPLWAARRPGARCSLPLQEESPLTMDLRHRACAHNSAASRLYESAPARSHLSGQTLQELLTFHHTRVWKAGHDFRLRNTSWAPAASHHVCSLSHPSGGGGRNCCRNIPAPGPGGAGLEGAAGSRPLSLGFGRPPRWLQLGNFTQWSKPPTSNRLLPNYHSLGWLLPPNSQVLNLFHRI